VIAHRLRQQRRQRRCPARARVSRVTTVSPPPTLARLAHQAVGIEAQCHDCRHKVALGFELFLERYGDMPFPNFARLLKCSPCGSRTVDARPVWPTR
jgi:hypothetical protein